MSRVCLMEEAGQKRLGSHSTTAPIFHPAVLPSGLIFPSLLGFSLFYILCSTVMVLNCISTCKELSCSSDSHFPPWCMR